MDFRYHGGLASVFTIDGQQGLPLIVFNTTGLAQFSKREQGIRDKHHYSDSLWLGNLRPKKRHVGRAIAASDSAVYIGLEYMQNIE